MKIRNFVFLSVAFLLLISSSYAQELPPGLVKLKQHQLELASSITFLLAFFAGLISMTSTCGIALLPAFFSFAFKERKKAVAMTTAFSLGLIIAFTMFGIIASMLGNFFNEFKLEFAVASGFALILFGILTFINRGFGISKGMQFKNQNFFGTIIMGFFFGAGWTPCAGPILIGILVLAANAATALNGALMLVFYGIGVATPLILLAYFSDKYDWASSRFLKGKEIAFDFFGKKIITNVYSIVGGILLIIIGILMVFYQGTFFFQTEIPKVIPWSMSFWGYMSEKAVESSIFTPIIGNILGIMIALIIVSLVYFYLRKRRVNKE